MGAWGAGPFDNDTALDWVWELDESSDLEVVRAAITGVTGETGYLDSDVACRGLAACEVVAASHGFARPELSEHVTAWQSCSGPQNDQNLVQQALIAMDRIQGDGSELRELWNESSSGGDWSRENQDLRARLEACASV